MEIKILEGNVNIYKEANNTNVIAFGNIKKNDSAKFKIKIEGADSSKLIPTCGCTATGSSEKNIYEIEYKNTHILETFSKVLVLDYVEGGKNLRVNIKMTGKITA